MRCLPRRQSAPQLSPGETGRVVAYGNNARRVSNRHAHPADFWAPVMSASRLRPPAKYGPGHRRAPGLAVHCMQCTAGSSAAGSLACGSLQNQPNRLAKAFFQMMIYVIRFFLRSPTCMSSELSRPCNESSADQLAQNTTVTHSYLSHEFKTAFCTPILISFWIMQHL